MKWKDTGGEKVENPQPTDPYYEDDGYTPFKEKGLASSTMLTGNPVRYLYWGLGIAMVVGIVLLVVLLFSNMGDGSDAERIRALEARVGEMEQQLEKIAGVDEKVTRIWEQAKSFETFKTRFDRTEASTSLRMDHLAMSLDALQKKTDETLAKVEALAKAPAPPRAAAPPAPAKKETTTKNTAAAAKTHTVAAGDTLYSISRRYGLSVDQLRSLNGLEKGAVIHVGQKLVVSSAGN